MLAVVLVVLLAGAVAYAARMTRAESEAAPPPEPCSPDRAPGAEAGRREGRASGGDPGRPRDDGARVDPRQARRVPRALGAEHDRARRQGRERRDRVRSLGRPAGEADRRGEAVLQAARRREARPRPGRVPDRAGRRDGGSGALGEAARARDPPPERRALAQPCGSRLVEPLRPPGLGVQRRRRRGRGAGRLRRDPVRLRPLPERRRHGGDRLPGQDLDAARLGDRRVRPLRLQAPEAARRPGLRRRLRPFRDARPRHRAGAQAARALPRRDLPDGLPVPLRLGRVQPRAIRTPIPAPRSPTRSGTSTASSPRPRRGSSRGSRTSPGGARTRSRTSRRRSTRPGAPKPAATCSGTPRASTPPARSSRRAGMRIKRL